ncbi:hypothetical protein [Panacibacter ginsenosidivorans]|nr:hypothetical protein [Panacibacter ginsenosidivorans]
MFHKTNINNSVSFIPETDITKTARYVSGYIETLAPEGKEKLAGVDASHA